MEKIINILKQNIFLIIAILITIFAIMPLFNPGFFPIHDDEQVGRLFELNYSLESGHFPPRISQNLGFGYGYPFFNFYPSFVYYVAQIFVFLGFGYIVSIKLMIALGFILSSVFMYLFAKNHVGKIGALVASAFYLYVPYHSIDVYVRGALPEFWSFVFVPAVFWAVYRLSVKTTLGNVVLLGVLGAFLMLTHNLVMLMTIPFVFIYFLYLLFNLKNKKSFFITVLCGGILALLLSAYFWIPAILENKYTMVNLLTKQLASYGLHFVSLTQFVNSPWGYGGSILGPNDGMSLEIGKLHIVLALVGGILSIYLLVKNKFKINVGFVFLILFVISVFLQSYYSKFVWDNIFALSYIQFPWRFMLFSVFSASFLAGFIFSFNYSEKTKIALATLLIVLVIALNFQYFKPSEYLKNVNDSDYISLDVIRWKTSAMAFEYVPFGIGTKESALNTTIVDITKEEVASQTATALTKDIEINSITDKPHYKKIEVNAKTKGKVMINTFSFPIWKVFINGKEISYNDKNKLRLLEIDVPKGSSIVEAKFIDTPIRKVSNILSLAGVILVVLLLSKRNKKI